MKARKQLQRKTPLRATKALVARKPLISRTELKTRVPLRSSTPISAVSKKRMRANRKRTVVVSAMREATFGRCAMCGDRSEVAGHERLARAQGGSILGPEALLCNVCNGWCEDSPISAAWAGWKISAKHPHDPALAIGQARRSDGTVVDFTIPIQLDPIEAIA